MSLAQIKIDTPVGPLFAVTSEKGLCSLQAHEKEILPPLADSLEEKILRTLIDQLTKYFARNLTEFTLPLDLSGTAFQKKVWKKLLEIPYGQTISYSQLAKHIGSPQSARAVGNANGKNPLWLIVPCHRVISSDARLGGYAGGLPMKEYLLRLENASLYESAKF